MTKEPTVSMVALVRDGGERLDRLMKWATHAPLFTRLEVYIDSRTTDDSAKVAKAYGAIVKTIRFGDRNLDAVFGEVHSAIRTDWGLHIGDDEIMGEWFDADLPSLLTGEADVWGFPRYNLVRPGVYNARDPLYPDTAWRLFRKGHIHHPGIVHEGPMTKGTRGYARPHLFHFDALDFTREERETKWSRYVAQGVIGASRDRGLPPWYYRQWSVPEDYEVLEAPCIEGCSLWRAVSVPLEETVRDA